MNLDVLVGAIELGLIYSLVAIAVFLSFRTLKFPDMTVDGSFPLGAAVAATLITKGVDPYLATCVAVLSGALAGFLTAWMSTHLRMLNLLAGILTMTALYSINLRVMGDRPNIALVGEITIFSEGLSQLPATLPLVVITIVFGLLIYSFLSSRIGLAVRATGSNPIMGRAQGIDDRRMIWLGLSVSNALVALAGALFAQRYGFADVSLGVGTIIIGLAAVIIGEALFHARTVLFALLACVIGAILYRTVIALALDVRGFGLKTSDLNLVTAVLVAVAMVLPTIIPTIKRNVNQFKSTLALVLTTRKGKVNAGKGKKA